jgi:hypothetical protein
MLMSSTMRWLLAILIIAPLLGCTGSNQNTGGDGERHQAIALPLNELVLDGNGVDYAAGDRTDWKKFQVPRTGPVVVEVTVDEPGSTIMVALYNATGGLLKEGSNRFSEDRSQLRVETNVSAGTCFVQIFARASSDKSIYSVRVALGGPGGEYIPPPE